MHPRNPYKDPPDFATLAQAYSPLQKFLLPTSGALSQSANLSETRGATRTINFKDEQALRCLTQAIMSRDFGIRLTIPEDRLCPPVPNRINYVLWIQDVVAAIKTHVNSDILSPVRGIDIGTGATAIYPLLACKCQPDWRLVGTELDDKSYESAVQNVQENALDNRISIRKATRDGLILFPLEDGTVVYDFTMCNPPFYSSIEEIDTLSKSKKLAPQTVCTGSEIEMVYSNHGEVGFVSRMVEESVRFQGRCRWYTSMLGKMSSAVKIVQLLQRKSITNYAVTAFVQGQTRRWAIGWSFLDGRLPDSVCRLPLHPSHTLASIMPVRTTLYQPLPSARTLNEVFDSLNDVLNAIDEDEGVVRISSPQASSCGWAFRMEAAVNAWSRSARRRKKRQQKHLAEVSEGVCVQEMGPPLPKLVCCIRVHHPGPRGDDLNLGDIEHEDWMDIDDHNDDDGEVELTSGEVVVHGQEEPEKRTNERRALEYSLEFQWISGMDRGLFESFAGHVGRKVLEGLVKH